LWANKTVLIIDEISMVSSKLMTAINEQGKTVKNLDDNSTAVFGGLAVVGISISSPPSRPRYYGKNK
jgi:hypothetical protein